MIYTPRSVIDQIRSSLMRDIPNVNACTKIVFHGFEMSISMDSSNRETGDLTLSEIRVYSGSNVGSDITPRFLEGDETTILGTAERLFQLMKQIEAEVSAIPCANCGRKIRKVGEHWEPLNPSPKEQLLQYCWVDPTGGSQLHTP